MTLATIIAWDALGPMERRLMLPKAKYMMPAPMPAYRPYWGGRPASWEKAIRFGTAKAATVSAANRSLRNHSRLYLGSQWTTGTTLAIPSG